MKPFYVYLLRCGDGRYYAGHTDDLDVRMMQHQEGAIGYTATRKPVELLWQGEFEARAGAMAFEQQIKGWSRAKKEALIAGDWGCLQNLAKSKGASGLNSKDTVRAELVEAPRALRQAQGERITPQPVRAVPRPEREGLPGQGSRL